MQTHCCRLTGRSLQTLTIKLFMHLQLHITEVKHKSTTKFDTSRQAWRYTHADTLQQGHTFLFPTQNMQDFKALTAANNSSKV